ncbi:MAG TPA: hypothetical protein VHA53_07940, partial [Nitrolancea sp.]|nr:hypothetical protein [Nitrolancea sp.]
MTCVLFRRLGTALGVVSMLVGVLAGFGGSVALAAPLTINVPCNTDSLISAINSANANTSGGTLILSPHCTYTITTPATAPTGLPVITGNVTIKGQAATITRDSDENTPAFRIFDVAAGATLNIDFLTISNGKSLLLGGAIQYGGTGTISNSTFSGNTASSGGAITILDGADLTVTTTSFNENTSSGIGGGAFFLLGTAHVSRSTFLGNTAPINGGAFNVQTSGLLTLFSSTLANNTSGGLGGAISNFGAASLTNLTFVGNVGSDGDAIATTNTTIRLSNSILNDVSDHLECHPAGTISGEYNLVSDDSCGSSPTSHVISPSHPLSLDPLQFNGGPTQTLLPSAQSSSVIDQIPVASCVAPAARALAPASSNP